MKRFLAISTACALALSIGSTALAVCSKAGGCGNCGQAGQFMQQIPGSAPAAESAAFRQFRINTLDLRQEMMNKRFDLQRENLKGTPDAAKVAVLKSDIRAIQAKINGIRLQSGLPEMGKRDGECYKMEGDCFKQDGSGGCNGQPCWQK